MSKAVAYYDLLSVAKQSFYHAIVHIVDLLERNNGPGGCKAYSIVVPPPSGRCQASDSVSIVVGVTGNNAFRCHE